MRLRDYSNLWRIGTLGAIYLFVRDAKGAFVLAVLRRVAEDLVLGRGGYFRPFNHVLVVLELGCRGFFHVRSMFHLHYYYHLPFEFVDV